MRRERTVTIEPSPPNTPEHRKSRDAGKKFLITEWDAETAEIWADRAIIAIGNSGAKIDHVRGMGWAGVAFLGLKALLGVQEGPALALVNELMDCVQIVEPAVTRQLTRDDIEEVETRWRLKREVFELHAGFSMAEMQSMLISAVAQLASLDTQTSQPPSDKPSQPVSESVTQN